MLNAVRAEITWAGKVPRYLGRGTTESFPRYLVCEARPNIPLLLPITIQAATQDRPKESIPLTSHLRYPAPKGNILAGLEI
jgi:hypothetical protein